MENKTNEVRLDKTNQNSILIKKDAKGNYNWEIKLYFDIEEEQTITRIKDIDAKLKEEFCNNG